MCNRDHVRAMEQSNSSTACGVDQISANKAPLFQSRGQERYLGMPMTWISNCLGPRQIYSSSLAIQGVYHATATA